MSGPKIISKIVEMSASSKCCACLAGESSGEGTAAPQERLALAFVLGVVQALVAIKGQAGIFLCETHGREAARCIEALGVSLDGDIKQETN